jgi:hypothetical protein
MMTGGAACAGAVQMNAIASDVNQFSERRRARSIAGLSGGNAGGYTHHENQQNGTGQICSSHWLLLKVRTADAGFL